MNQFVLSIISNTQWVWDGGAGGGGGEVAQTGKKLWPGIPGQITHYHPAEPQSPPL